MEFEDLKDKLRDELTECIAKFKASLPDGVTVTLDEDEVDDNDHEFKVSLVDERIIDE